MEMEAKSMKDAAAESITARLSSLNNLYFPRAVQSTAASSDQRKSILLDLLRRDPAVFLERYGSELRVDELLEFDALKHDYEVDWHLKNLRKKISPASEELKSRSVAVRNRRLVESSGKLEEFQSMWTIKEKDLAMKKELSKMSLLESLIGKKEPLSESEEALKEKLLSDIMDI